MGYFESTCVGLMVAHFINDTLRKRPIKTPPRQSAMGSLLNAITEYKKNFQPTNINFGLFPNPPGMDQTKRKDRELKRELQVKIAKEAFNTYAETYAESR